MLKVAKSSVTRFVAKRHKMIKALKSPTSQAPLKGLTRLAPQRLPPSGCFLVARYHATNQLEKSTRIRP